ncbi:MAG: hypothetical protein ABWY27_07310 [Telluria sp.]|jgi:hypothetical protein
MSDVEQKLLKIYDGSKPVDEELFETSHVNQVAWTLAVVLAGLVVWLCIALVNAENQRNALMTKQCADPLFKGELDQKCLVTVRSRDHWWEHLGYALTHVTQSTPTKK